MSTAITLEINHKPNNFSKGTFALMHLILPEKINIYKFPTDTDTWSLFHHHHQRKFESVVHAFTLGCTEITQSS